MGNKFEQKRWKKFCEPLFKKLISRNRYSQYLDIKKLNYEESMVLQAVVLSDLGHTIRLQTNASEDDVIGLFEKFFESDCRKHKRFGKIFFKWIWRGIDADELRNVLIGFKDCPTPRELGPALADVVVKQGLIERKLKANRYYYISNGYKQLIRSRKFTVG